MSSGSRLAHRHTTGERHAGWVALALTVICWVGSSELMQWMQEGNAYDNPVAITMSCACSFVLYGGLVAARHGGVLGSSGSSLTTVLMSRGRSLGFVAGTFTLLWISANLAFTASLGRTSSASAVTIASTSALFALMASVATGIEEFSRRKALAVAVSVIGTALTATADSTDSGEGHKSQLFGDALALSSAAMYAMYLVLFQKDVGESIPTEEFLFVVGVWGVCLTPVALVFEPVVLPTARQAIALTLNAVVGTAVSERAWLYGATRCGPTTATMALALTIPCTAAIDVARGRLSGLHGATGLSWGAGLALICAGFVLASTSEEDVDDDGVLVTDAKPFDYEENSGGEDGALLNGRSPTMQSPAAMRDALRVEYEARVRGRLP